MALSIKLKDLLDDPSKLKAFKQQTPTSPFHKCAKCGCGLDVLTGRNPSSSGLMCNDCYYDALGELIEQHPIVSPMKRG